MSFLRYRKRGLPTIDCPSQAQRRWVAPSPAEVEVGATQCVTALRVRGEEEEA